MENKRFEEWEEVDCNECGRYWDSTCDGVKGSANSDNPSTGRTRLCNSFLPTRKVVIPAQLNALEKRIDRLRIYIMLNTLLIIAHLLTHILGG